MNDGFGEWPDADDHAAGGEDVHADGGGIGYTEADLDAAIETLTPATRDRIRLVLDTDETLREWVRTAIETADPAVVSGDPVETIQMAVWHRFRTEVDPDHEFRADVPIGLPAEAWTHLKARALARWQRRDEYEGSDWRGHRDPETILADLLFEYVTFDPVIHVDGERKTAADVFDADVLEDTPDADEREP